MSIHVLGIRHHGPGSALRVKEELERLNPDLILLEGPSEADELLQYVTHKKMRPPVSILAYQIDEPQNASFYPFAEFSPEWQAMLFSQKNNIPLRFFDLPLAHKMGLIYQEQQKQKEELEKLEQELLEQDIKNEEALEQAQVENSDDKKPTVDNIEKEQVEEQTLSQEEENSEEEEEYISDPMGYFARIDGMADGEEWWDNVFERRLNNEDAFEAITQAMSVLRSELPNRNEERDNLREAWMRKCIRAAVKEGFEKIAIVCGAFHAPALVNYEKIKVKDDNALLKGLPKVKIGITWIPWTYSRLSYRSGYGAGISSPGFYEHLFHNPKDDGSIWLTKAAKVLRRAKFDISAAHVIESIRLANTLAALRNIPHANLKEFNEAITTVMGFGDSMLLRVVNERLIVGQKIGSIPSEVPKVPLIADLERLQKKYRLPFTKEEKEFTLDLRKEFDLGRSTLLHRLNLLEMKWGKTTYGTSKGTFKEIWKLSYKPESLIELIEKAIWGNTVEDAVFNYVTHNMQESTSIANLTGLLNKVIPCDMPKLCDALTNRINEISASGSDITDLMCAVPSLCEIVRYGTVRKLDFSAIADMLKTMLERINAGGLMACINIADDTAEHIMNIMSITTRALTNLNDKECLDIWIDLMNQVHTTSKVHPLLCGLATRVLRQCQGISNDKIIESMSYYTSHNNKPLDMAFYLEGFLKDSGTLIVIDNTLWSIVYNFITLLPKEDFDELLPILRRSFSEFESTERQQMGQKAKQTASGNLPNAQATTNTNNPTTISNNGAVGSAINVLFGGAVVNKTQDNALHDEQAKKVIELFKSWFAL